jgi:ABC-type branched-subunit amino acid transport system substrate-binding protein
MKRTLIMLTALLAIVSVLAACGEQAPQTPATGGGANTKAAIIGFTASLTGKSNVESIRQKNGLQLWMNQVKTNGGVALTDGSKVTFDAKSYDDESNKDRVQELYARLVNDDKADFLISPYGSGPADAAAVLAEQYGKIMITTGAASDGTYKKGYTLVYQVYTPASRYLTGAIDALAKLDPTAKKVAIVHENDKFSTDVVNALKTYAEGKGYQVVVFEGYDTNTTDFGPIINKVQQAQPEAILGGGHFQDGNTFAKQLHEKKLNAKFLSLLVAPPEPKFAELGDAALGVVGPSQWEPSATFTADAAKAAEIEWLGPSGAEFVNAYKAAYNGEEPSYHAAGGYVAGLILQKAIEKAGSLDTKAIQTALDGMDILTFFGHIKFNTSSEAHGLQIGHDMVYIQWQKDAGGKLVKQVIWPDQAMTAKALYPIH